jgi:hypothetical protein
MTSRIYIGTHFEAANWRDTINKLYESTGARAIDA